MGAEAAFTNVVRAIHAVVRARITIGGGTVVHGRVLAALAIVHGAGVVVVKRVQGTNSLRITAIPRWNITGVNATDLVGSGIPGRANVVGASVPIVAVAVVRA
jgi:hypothetical protein